MSTWPPTPPPPPPVPPWPPAPQPPPRRTPWQPEPAYRPSAPSQSVVVNVLSDWLGERLLDRRIVSLAGPLGPEATNQAVASLALLDASGDDPIQLRLYDPRPDTDGELDIVLTLLDTIDLLGVPLHATCLGGLTGTVVTLLAVADHRTAGANSVVTLREPRIQLHGSAAEVSTQAEQQRRQLRHIQQRIADACKRPLDTVIDDMRAGRVLTADQARDYGLIDAVSAPTVTR
jgi:ATP-dependent Clp protease, protease subunit